jgi:hypothetical protein
MRQPSAPQQTPRPRALYLAGSEHKHVESTDAALVVQNARGQILRYPVARVSRIVSSPRVDWAGSALLLCQQSGIPITWIDSHGKATGTLFPARSRSLSLHQMLEVVLETKPGAEDFLNWHLHRRMQVMQAWAESHPDPIAPSQWEAVRREWVYRQEFSAHLPGSMRGLCCAHIAAQMAQAGLQPDYLGPKAEVIPMMQILAELAWAQLNLCTGALGDQADDEATQVQLMERWQARNGGVLLAHLHSLQRWAIAQMSQT